MKVALKWSYLNLFFQLSLNKIYGQVVQNFILKVENKYLFIYLYIARVPNPMPTRIVYQPIKKGLANQWIPWDPKFSFSMKLEIVKKDLVPIAVTCKLPFLEISLAAIDKLQKQKGSVQWGKSVNVNQNHKPWFY